MTVTIENGFAEVGAGTWLASLGQPAASFGEAVRRRRRGWFVRDRAALELVETAGRAFFADASRPFLTHIPCAAPIFSASAKVLLAPASAWCGATLLRPIPMSVRSSLCITHFAQEVEGREVEGLEVEDRKVEGRDDGLGRSDFRRSTNSWVVMATASRTRRVAVEDGDTLSVLPRAVVAWTGSRPTGFVRRLGVWDILLPRAPRDLMLHFHGPCIIWIEGSSSQLSAFNFSTFNSHPRRRTHGV